MTSPVVLVLVSQRYNPREFWIALQVLTQAGIKTDIVSTSKVIQNEETGEAHRIKKTVVSLASAASTDYHGLVVISGNPPDTEFYYKHQHTQRLVREFNEEGKPLAAICAAVPTLAPALKGKAVSWFPLQKSRNILSTAGAILREVGLTLDQNVVTAENEWMTRPWMECFRDLILGVKPQVPTLTPSGLSPKKIPRRDIPEVQATIPCFTNNPTSK